MREIASVFRKLSGNILATEYQPDGSIIMKDAYTGESKGKLTEKTLERSIEAGFLTVLAYRDELPWDDE
jgi:hypothetical protein